MLIGWSTGGLVAVARQVAACVVLAPNLPARAEHPAAPLREGEFGAEVYGILGRDSRQQPSMPDLELDERRLALASLGRESRLARDERARGVVVPFLGCPLLLVTGTADAQWPAPRYVDFPLPAQRLVAESASHWGLVLNRRKLDDLVPRVAACLDRQLDPLDRNPPPGRWRLWECVGRAEARRVPHPHAGTRRVMRSPRPFGRTERGGAGVGGARGSPLGGRGGIVPSRGLQPADRIPA